MADSDCLFCRILNGDVPSTEVLSTTGTYAFRDVNPAAPVHVLVVPRIHIPHAGALRAEDALVLAEMFSTARDVAASEGVLESGYRLVLNVGDDALNSVPHLHLHVLGGRRMGWPPG
ncbi:MAG: histidine triad nucleotide-binding protein [Actinomycetota bacterium]|nr:histidine triad nucleotide-binding protein [Actinomycetota bacterium]